MKKKLAITLIWLAIITILVNVCYYLILEGGIGIVKNKLDFSIKYHFREIIETNIEYNDYNENNIISKNNLSVKLSNISYEKNSGDLKIKFEVCTNDDQILEGVGSVIRIYDENKLFYHSMSGNLYMTDNIDDYLLYNTNVYDEIKITENYNVNIYGELDDTNFNLDKLCEITTSEDDKFKIIELSINLGENYQISDKLFIDFLDMQYKTVDEFTAHRLIEPLGELKFIIEF